MKTKGANNFKKCESEAKCLCWGGRKSCEIHHTKICVYGEGYLTRKIGSENADKSSRMWPKMNTEQCNLQEKQ